MKAKDEMNQRREAINQSINQSINQTFFTHGTISQRQKLKYLQDVIFQ